MYSSGVPLWLPWCATLRKCTGLMTPSRCMIFQLRISASPANSNLQPRHCNRKTMLVLLAALSMASRLSGIPLRIVSTRLRNEPRSTPGGGQTSPTGAVSMSAASVAMRCSGWKRP